MMGIVIKHIDNSLYCPFIKCEVCGKDLKDGEAAYCFDMALDVAPVHFVCKKPCMDEFKENSSMKYFGWHEIAHLISCIKHNTDTSDESIELQERHNDWLI